MRTFEVMIVVMLFLSLAARVDRQTRGTHASALFVAATLLAISMHIWFEDLRWQMAPAYLLAGFTFVAAAAGLPQRPPDRQSGTSPVPGVMLVKARNVFFVLLGAAGLALKGRYSGPWRDMVHSYAGNLSASFALYFMVAHLFLRRRFGKLLAAGLALAVVQLFEASDGFGVMRNVYDAADFGANAVGVGLALVLDIVLARQPGNFIRRMRSWNRGSPQSG